MCRGSWTLISAKCSLLARQCRVHCAESFLSAQALPRGIVPVSRASRSRQSQ
jgi:hypothetical protein